MNVGRFDYVLNKVSSLMNGRLLYSLTGIERIEYAILFYVMLEILCSDCIFTNE